MVVMNRPGPSDRTKPEARRGFLHIPAIKVRQAAQADNEPPTFVRPRFSWDLKRFLVRSAISAPSCHTSSALSRLSAWTRPES
jgi:hypothetical protein